jgi:hypothetical protein
MTSTATDDLDILDFMAMDDFITNRNDVLVVSTAPKMDPAEARGWSVNLVTTQALITRSEP